METLRVYWQFQRLAMRGRMQYKTDFLIGIFSVIFLNAVNLTLLGTLATRFKSIGGWSLWELVFLYSIWMLGHSVYSLLFWHFRRLDEFIVMGQLDRFMIRPAGVLLQYLAQGVQYVGVGDVAVGIGGIALAYANLGLHWGAGRWLLLLLFVLAGAAVETGLMWLLGCIAFWAVRAQAAFQIASTFNNLVQQYPIEVFGNWFRVTVTGLLPFAFMNYYPSLVLLDKAPAGTVPWYGYLSPLVAVVMLGISYSVWRVGLNKYGGTGS